MTPNRLRLLGLLAAGALACGPLLARATDLTVSSAASLSNALKELAPLFEAANPGTRVQFNFGASGPLLQQMAKGAPVDVYASADQETMDQAQALGLIKPELRRNVVSNVLVVIVPSSAASVPLGLKDLAQATYTRVAIGIPASVPAGRYAKSALEAAGTWAAVEPKIIGAQTVRQALDYVARGEVDAGFVYATDAALLPAKVRVAFAVATTKPVLYPAAPLAASPNPVLARKFVDFLTAAQAQAVLARYGFGKP